MHAHPGSVFATLALAALAAFAGCSSEPTSCDEAACDPASQYCRFFGSDTLAPPSASCAEIPEACAAGPTCECVLDEENDSIATCEVDGELVVVTIPGG